jgi:DNA-binding NarL/FixJ family response regulator
VPEVLRLNEVGFQAVPVEAFGGTFSERSAAVGIGQLSSKECVVLSQMGRGDSVTAIADRLELDQFTVRAIEGSIMRKLCLRTRIEAGALANELCTKVGDGDIRRRV